MMSYDILYIMRRTHPLWLGKIPMSPLLLTSAVPWAAAHGLLTALYIAVGFLLETQHLPYDQCTEDAFIMRHGGTWWTFFLLKRPNWDRGRLFSRQCSTDGSYFWKRLWFGRYERFLTSGGKQICILFQNLIVPLYHPLGYIPTLYGSIDAGSQVHISCIHTSFYNTIYF